MQVHYRLSFDDNGYPMMYVFKNCKAFIRTIPTLIYDEHKVEDLNTEGEDHIATVSDGILTVTKEKTTFLCGSFRLE